MEKKRPGTISPAQVFAGVRLSKNLGRFSSPLRSVFPGSRPLGSRSPGKGKEGCGTLGARGLVRQSTRALAFGGLPGIPCLFLLSGHGIPQSGSVPHYDQSGWTDAPGVPNTSTTAVASNLKGEQGPGAWEREALSHV